MATPARPVPDGTGLSNGELVRRVREGDRDLFAVLVRRYDQRVYRAARAILRVEAEVEDAMQRAWIQGWRTLEQLADGEAFGGWITRIAVNEALGRVRRRRPPEPWVEDAMEARGSADPEVDAATRELVRMVERSVDDLPAAQRLVFVLRDVDGLSTEETAAALGVSSGAVKVRLHRAHRALRAAVGDATGAAPRAFRFEAPRCSRMVARVMALIEAEEGRSRAGAGDGRASGPASPAAAPEAGLGSDPEIG